MDNNVNDRPLRQIVLQRLESLQRAGVTQLARREPAETCVAPSPPHTAETDVAGSGDGGKSAPSDRSTRQSELDVIQQNVAGCTRCAELARTRTQTVFGVGNPSARLVFLGEAPGADEDAQGIPFVGRAGQLLTKIIQACTL